MAGIRSMHACFLLVLCIFVGRVPAQLTTISRSFDQITTRDGLPYNNVKAALQDHAGFMWFATTEGLARYDGSTFTVFKHDAKDPESIIHNEVFTIAIDTKGVIWCGTETGVSAYDPVRGKFTNFPKHVRTGDPKFLESSPITKIVVDRDDNVWIGSWNNLDMFDQRTQTFTHFYHSDTDAASIRDHRVGALLHDSKRRMWIGTFQGLDRYDPRTQTFEHHTLPSRINPRGPLITCIYEDNTGMLWLTTWGDGLIRYDPESRRSTIFLPEPGRTPSASSNVATSILQTTYAGEEGKLWVATKSSGLHLFDIKSESWAAVEQTQRSSKHFLTSDITALFDDGLGNLFLCTGEGILKYSRSKDIFKMTFMGNLDPMECLANVHATYEDPLDPSGNTIWVGTWTCGSFKYDKATATFEKLAQLSISHDPQTENNAGYQFYRDRMGWLWARTREGVFVSKEDYTFWEKVPQDDRDSLKRWNTPALAMLEDNDGTFWFATKYGLEHYDAVTERVRRIDVRAYAEKHGLAHSEGVVFGYSLCQAPQNIIWLAGARGALIKYDKLADTLGMLRHDPNDPSSFPFSYDIRKVIADRQQRIWTSSVNGLMTFDPTAAKPVFTVYHTTDGLPSERIYDLELDAEGKIWIMTHNGLSCFNPVTKQFRTYSEAEGLLGTESIEFSPYGTMYVHGIQLFQSFDPAKIAKNQYCGPIRLTGIKVLGKDLSGGNASAYTDSVQLSYNENEVTVSFAMLNYADAGLVTYEYFLEGFSDKWIPLGKNHQVTFTNLDGGTYYLHVRGYNADGAMNEARGLLTLVISPPFWKTPWFYSVLGLGVLAGVFGYTRIRVRNLNRQKQILEETVEHRTEQLRHEKENVERQKLRAEQSEQFKEQFLANMSHEIRTPMNAVMGMTNILLEKKPTGEQAYYLDRIRRSSETLLVIINDILDLSKIEAGKMELEQIPFYLRETLQLVCDTLRHKAEEKGLLLDCNVDGSVPDVLIGDPTRLQQILINLTGNAIKFTEKGSVSISCSSSTLAEHQTQLMFSVADTGIGMTRDQVGQIFHSFVQASSDTTRKYGGTGLGLSISKQLVELHGGKITVASEPGIGSTFSFSINYRTASGADVFRKKRTITEAMLTEMQGLRILITDDNEYNRIVARDTLELKVPGVKIDEAAEGLEAVQKFTANDYDIVLMDVQMPLLDGYDTTRRIRSEFPEPKNRVPVIALTASVIRSDLEKCMQAGMNGYVAKPFRVDELLCAIHSTLHGEQMQLPEEDPRVLDAEVSRRVTDLAFLKEFTEGDEVQMRKYIALYLESAPQSLDRIRQALETKDHVAIQRTAHQLKPHLRFMGMTELSGIAEKIEHIAATNIQDGLPELVSILHTACETSFAELSEYIRAS